MRLGIHFERVSLHLRFGTLLRTKAK